MLIAGLAAGCAEERASPTADAAVDAAGQPAYDTAAAGDVAPSEPCSLGGTGRLRVAVTLDPLLMRRAPEVWLSARCGSDDRELRVVRWDRSPSMVLDGFGPGAYSVVASSFIAAPARTARIDLDPRSTASLSVTLPGEPAALAVVRAGGAGAADAGLARPDGAVVEGDGGARPSWSGRVAIDGTPGAAALGSVEVDAVQASESAIELRVVVRNTCATSACPAIVLAGAEARALLGDVPTGVAEGRFDRPQILAGESSALVEPISLRGALPGAQGALHLAVYGVVRAPGAAAMRP
ncbi:MAG: hypothetical protein R3A48_03365 [Polyangiales bacterium]